MADQNLTDNFKSLVWDNLVKLALKQGIEYLSARFGLAWLIPTGFLYGILVNIVLYIAGKFYIFIAQWINMEAIMLKNQSNLNAFATADEKLAIIAKDYGPASDQFKEAHVQEQQAFYKLVERNASDTSSVSNGSAS